MFIFTHLQLKVVIIFYLKWTHYDSYITNLPDVVRRLKLNLFTVSLWKLLVNLLYDD